MESAISNTTLPEQPPNDVTSGLDWARDDHAVSVVDGRGREIARHTVEHSAAGLRELIDVLARAGAQEVAIERLDGPVVDALLAAGLTVVVISPNQVKNLRGRYGSAGNKDDRFDAFVLADTLRTDRARLRPLIPDSPDTVALRRACRTRKDLVNHRVGLANHLRAHLHNAFPGAVGLFAEIDSEISVAFLTRFDTQDRADWLTPTRLGKWLDSVGYSGRTDPAVLHARLTGAPRGAVGTDGQTQAHVTHALIAVLSTLLEQIKTLSAQISTQLAAHADQHIFTSLPRSGRVRAARLLAEIGDCRARFPTPDSLACLAGAAPSTRQSGKLRSVGFRWACDKQLRDAVGDFAGDSRHASPWAANLYQRARDRGHDHAHAVRILARAWLFVIWHCWQHHVPYDPTKHKARQRVIAHQATPTQAARMPRQPDLDTSPTRCIYAERPTERPHCQLTAVVRYGTTTLCADCQARRSTLGKGHPPRRLPPHRELDVIQWLATTDEQLHQAHAQLAAHRARAQGHSWTTIGATPHTSRQAAQQRFTKDQRREG